MADELMPIAGTEETLAREGSIIIVVATDAPLLPHQLTRLVSTTPPSLPSPLFVRLRRLDRANRSERCFTMA